MRIVILCIFMILLGACAEPKLHPSQCDDKESCEKAFTSLLDSESSKKNDEDSWNFFKAIEYAIKACDFGSGEGCMFAGVFHEKTQRMFDFDLSTSPEKAKQEKLFSETFAEHLYEHFGIKPDVAKARGYYEKAIALGFFEAYIPLGSLYLRGVGVKQNFLKAKEYFSKACDKGFNGSEEACEASGLIYRHGGEGVKKDINKAIDFYKKVVILVVLEVAKAVRLWGYCI